MKRTFGILLLLALLISACQGAAQTGTVPDSTTAASAAAPASPQAYGATPAAAADTATAPVADTPTPGQPEATQLAQANAAVPAGCTAVSQKPNPTVASLFPPVTDQDWQQGPSDAQVTIVEYGDFM